MTDVFRRKAALERDLAAVEAEELHLVTALDDLDVERLDTAYSAARGYYGTAVPIDAVKRLRGAIAKRVQRSRTPVPKSSVDRIAPSAPRSHSGTEEITMTAKSRLRRRTTTTTEEWMEPCEGEPCPPGLSGVEAAEDEREDAPLNDVEGDDDEAA